MLCVVAVGDGGGVVAVGGGVVIVVTILRPERESHVDLALFVAHPDAFWKPATL